MLCFQMVSLQASTGQGFEEQVQVKQECLGLVSGSFAFFCLGSEERD